MFTFYPIWIKFGIADVHKKLLSHCEFHDNQQSQGQTFSISVNENVFMCVLPLKSALSLCCRHSSLCLAGIWTRYFLNPHPQH